LFPIGWKLLHWDFSSPSGQQKYLEARWEMGKTGIHFYLGFSQNVSTTL
jgi:hypothetical protein